MTSTTTGIRRIANVVVPVADVDRAIAFYTEQLGMEKRTDVPFGGEYRWVEVAPAGAETVIALAPPGAGGESGNRVTGISLETADIDGLHTRLRDGGVDVDAEVSRMGDGVPPLFWFRDHEGNTLMAVEVN